MAKCIDDDGMKCECVITDEGNGILEIKRISLMFPHFSEKGCQSAD